MSRPARLTLAFLTGTAIVGLAATLYVVIRDEPLLRYPGHAILAAGLTVALGTIGNLLVRFVRWHFLLRRLDVRLPTMPSLSAFFASFAFMPVPLYLGEVVARARLVPAESDGDRGQVILAAVWERILDAWTITLLATLVLPTSLALAVVGAAAVFLLPVGRRAMLHVAVAAARFCSRLVIPGESVVTVDGAIAARAGRLGVFVPCLLASVVAWGITAASSLPLALASGIHVGAPAVMGVVARAIAVGAASLVPLGAATSGIALFRGLQHLGAGPAEAAPFAFVFRVATAWLTLGLGGLALLLHLARRGHRTPHDHFDAIDECYDTWLPEAYRAHLVDKKTAPIVARLGALGSGVRRGLDVGCGRGWYFRALERAGAVMVGMDTSTLQLTAARAYLRAEAPLARASVLGIPFRAGCFDFAYIINVLHHLPSAEHQRRALAEIASAVRPGGLVFVHEMNVRNPLFRFYLSYVFPILKGIEEGTEHYLDPRTMDAMPGLRLCEVRYFSFLPDFAPAAVLRMFAPMERRLEESRLAPMGAHFLAVFERTSDGALPA